MKITDCGTLKLKNLLNPAESLRLMASALENIARSEIKAPSIEHYLTANQMTRALR